jgi:hypothetical protein
MTTFCLFEGRHELPKNQGALCSSFDFDSMTANKTQAWHESMEMLCRGEEVSVLVTGLTPALTMFISEAMKAGGSLTLLHFNNKSGLYVPQKIW